MVPTDYLPPREPTDNPVQPAKKSSTRTLLLWVALIVVFVAIYGLFSSEAPPREHVAHAAPAGEPLGWMILSRVWPFALIGLFVWWLRRQMRGGTKLNQRLEPGLLALADGDPARAAAVFREVAEQYRGQATYLAACRLQLSLALERLRDLGAAIDEAIRVERGAGLLYGSELRLAAAIHLGRLFVLRGEQEAAAQWIADARRRLGRAQGRLWAAAQLRVTEAFFLARQSRPVEALRLLEADWSRIEEQLSVATMRPAWLLRAFLVAQESGPREQAGAEPWLRMLRTMRPAELDYLTREWPELRAFVELSSVGGGGGEPPTERWVN